MRGVLVALVVGAVVALSFSPADAKCGRKARGECGHRVHIAHVAHMPRPVRVVRVVQAPDGAGTDIREEDSDQLALSGFASMAILAIGQTYSPLLPPITHDGHPIRGSYRNPAGDRILTLGTEQTARLWDGLEGVEERYNLEAVSSPSGVTHLTFTRR